MANDSYDTDILIAGAGPVGLFLANECARRGLRWQLIEASSSQSAHSKALAIFPRTLEIFDMAGLVAPFLERANRVTKVAILTHDRPLAHMRFAPEESPYSFIGMVPQNITEQLLVEALRAKGGDIQYETELRFGGAAGRIRDCHGRPPRRTHKTYRVASSSAVTAPTARSGTHSA